MPERRVGLLGATGYTGRLVAAELAARGIHHRRGARSAVRLAALPTAAACEDVVVDTTSPAALRHFLAGLDVVISTVGPFARLGPPVVAAAVAAGVPYVDSTGEWSFMRHVYDRYAGAGTPVVPACGFDYLPGDLAAALAAADLCRPAETVRVTYDVAATVTSRGTVSSGLGMIRGARPTPYRSLAPFPDGDRPAVQIPWGEELTVPRHLPGTDVRTSLTVSAPVARVLGAAAPIGPALALLARPALWLGSPLLARLAGRLPEGPAPAERAATTFRILVEARAGGQVRPDGEARAGLQVRADPEAHVGGEVRRVLVEGRDPYALTARLLVEAALRVQGTGALAPAQALPAAEFLDSVSGDLLRWRRLPATG